MFLNSTSAKETRNAISQPIYVYASSIRITRESAQIFVTREISPTMHGDGRRREMRFLAKIYIFRGTSNDSRNRIPYRLAIESITSEFKSLLAQFNFYIFMNFINTKDIYRDFYCE